MINIKSKSDMIYTLQVVSLLINDIFCPCCEITPTTISYNSRNNYWAINNI